MDRLTPEERADALAIIRAESDRALSQEAAEAFLNAVIGRAVRLHRLYETACNRELNKREAREVEEIEGVLRDDFRTHGLGLYLNGDPRGNPVGILTPKTGRHNTMGGREDGWRL
jgi:hypothetical protein